MSNLPQPIGNPTGAQGSVALRRSNIRLAKALLAKGDEPCDLPEFAGMTFFEAGRLSLMRLYAYGDKDAIREVHNRIYGRVPLEVDAQFTMNQPTGDATTDELISRVERLRNEAMQLRGAASVIDVESEHAGSNPLDAGSNPDGDRPVVDTQRAKETP